MKKNIGLRCCVMAVVMFMGGGCGREPQLFVETRTHGYDFVDENGEVLDTATSLDEIGQVLDKTNVKKLLRGSRVTIQFFDISPNFKGIQVPRGLTTSEIVVRFRAELMKRGVQVVEVEYD